MSAQNGFSHTSEWALMLPTNSNGNYQPDSGIFDPYLADLPIARVTFLASPWRHSACRACSPEPAGRG